MFLWDIFFRMGLTGVGIFGTIVAYLTIQFRLNPSLAADKTLATTYGASMFMTAVFIVVALLSLVWS